MAKIVVVKGSGATGTPGSNTPPVTTSNEWLIKSGTKVTLAGATYRTSGINAYWLGNNDNDTVGSPAYADYPSIEETNAAFDSAVSLGVNFIRATSIGCNYGAANSVVTGRDSNGFIINSAAWAPIDAAIRRARTNKQRLMIPLTDIWRYYSTADGSRQTGQGGRWWFVHSRATAPQPAPSLNLLRSKTAAENEDSLGFYYAGVVSGSAPTLSLDTNWFAHGTKSLKVMCNSADYSWIYINNAINGAPVVVGQQYTAAMTVRRTLGTFGVAPKINWFDSSGTYISGTSGTGTAAIASSGTTIKVTAAAPANAAFALPQLEFTTVSTVGDALWIDDWAIYNDVGPTAWVAPSGDYVTDTNPDLRITTFSDKSGQNRTAQVTLEKYVEQQFYTNPVIRQDFKNWITLLMNHTVDGLALKNDPVCMIWELGNELGDLAGPGNNTAAGYAWTVEMSAHIKSLSPNSWVASGYAAHGAKVINDPSLTVANVDIVGTHAYYNKPFDSTFFADLQADYDAAVANNKLFVIGEAPLHNSQRAALFSWIETHQAVLFVAHWSIIPTGQVHGFNLSAAGVTQAQIDASDDVPLHYLATNSYEQSLVNAIVQHSANMKNGTNTPVDNSTPPPTPPPVQATSTGGVPLDGFQLAPNNVWQLRVDSYTGQLARRQWDVNGFPTTDGDIDDSDAIVADLMAQNSASNNNVGFNVYGGYTNVIYKTNVNTTRVPVITFDHRTNNRYDVYTDVPVPDGMIGETVNNAPQTGNNFALTFWNEDTGSLYDFWKWRARKVEVSCKTSNNVNISPFPSIVDGYTLRPGDFVLVSSQTNKIENGIYVYLGGGRVTFIRAAGLHHKNIHSTNFDMTKGFPRVLSNGVVPENGETVLFSGQTDVSQNGYYKSADRYVGDVGGYNTTVTNPDGTTSVVFTPIPPAAITGADTGFDYDGYKAKNTYDLPIKVLNGTTFKGQYWKLVTQGDVTYGISQLDYVQDTSATAGNPVWMTSQGGYILDLRQSRDARFPNSGGASASGVANETCVISVAEGQESKRRAALGLSQRGVIKHAVTFGYRSPADSRIVSWPAQRSDGAVDSSPWSRKVIYGQRFRLDPAYNPDANAAGKHHMLVALEWAVHDYGALANETTEYNIAFTGERGSAVNGLASDPWDDILRKPGDTNPTPYYSVLTSFPFAKLQALPRNFGRDFVPIKKTPVGYKDASYPGQLPANTRDPALQPFTSDSPWNTSIALNAAFEAVSDAKTAMLLDFVNYGPGINQVNFSSHLDPSSLDDPLAYVTDRNYSSRKGVYNISSLSVPTGTDKHLDILHPEGWIVNEATNVTKASNTSFDAARHVTVNLLGKGVGSLNGVRAYGGSALGGLIRAHEVDPDSTFYTGRISHAIALSADFRQLLYSGGAAGYGIDGTGNLKGYVSPATEQDSNSSTQYTGLVPLGSYLAIPAGVNLSTAGITTTSGTMLARALQDYGAYITDAVSGAGMSIHVESNAPVTFRDELLANSSADLKKILGLIRVCTSNGSGNINGGPVGSTRKQTAPLPLPGRSFFKPELPSNYIPRITQVGVPQSASSGFATSLSLPLQDGLKANDAVYVIGQTDLNKVLTPPDGYVAVGSTPFASSGSVRVYVWRKYLTAAETGSIIVTSPGNATWHVRSFALRGVDVNGAEVVPTVNAGNSSVAAARSLALGPFTIPSAGSILVTGFASKQDAINVDSDGRPNIYNNGTRLVLNIEDIPDSRPRGRTLMFGRADVVDSVAFGFAVKPGSGTTPPVTEQPTTTFTTNLYVNPNSSAVQAMNAETNVYRKAMLRRVSDQPMFIWFTDPSQNPTTDISNLVGAASAINKVPAIVVYGIPGRDNGSYSAGGASSAAAYRTWIDQIAAGIGSNKIIVILEPDALPGIDALDATRTAERYDLFKYAVAKFKALGNVSTYLDAGHSAWKTPSDIAPRLQQAGIADARGFSINISNFHATDLCVNYGRNISALVSNKPFIIDTSRNGNGAPDQSLGEAAYINPDGRALGLRPGSPVSDPLIDAYFWIKVVGESDGSRAGAPPAGVFYPDYAIGLADRAPWAVNELSTTFTDIFDAVDKTKWNYAATDVVVTGGRLQLTPTTSYPGVYSVFRFNLSSVSVQLVQAPTVPSTGAGQAIFQAELNMDNQLQLLWENNSLICREKINGTITDVSTIYNSNEHRYLRIRNSNGINYWETSADYTNWIILRQKVATFATTNLRIMLLAGSYGTTTPPGTVLFDNVNVAASAYGAGVYGSNYYGGN